MINDKLSATPLENPQAENPPIISEIEDELESRKWAEDNADIINAYNAMVEKYGLPLEKYRMF